MSLAIQKTKIYKSWLAEMKEKIRLAQIKAAVVVNKELLTLYWQIGEEIYQKQQQTNWGEGFIDQLSIDLLKEFPEVKGFSRTNLFYIKKWYVFYTQNEKVPQLVGQFKPSASKALKVPQAVAQLQKKGTKNEIVPQLVGLIPWGHHREIISKAKNIKSALGVSEYKLQEALPKKMQSQLPSIKELEKQLKKKL
jgi:hypothetical protein